jgi:ankyrin repeat protein
LVLDKSSIDINSTDNEGTTALHFVMADGALDSVMLLFERGALLSIVNNNGLSLLHIAVSLGEEETIKCLLENSTLNINSADSHGTTPMTLALWRGGLDSAKLLIEKGANLFMKKDEGTSAIDVRSWDPQNAALLGPQVLLHAKELRWSSIKDFLLLSKACQSQARRVATDTALSVDEGDATTLSRSRSVRLAASILLPRSSPSPASFVTSVLISLDQRSSSAINRSPNLQMQSNSE